MPRHDTVVSPREIEIPPEILGKIYLQNDLPHYPAHRGARYPPMAVSKSWRNAALSHPQLWVRINILAYSDLTQSSPDTIKTWLSRSKPCLLDVAVNFFQPELLKDVELFEPIMEVLFAQTYRWGNLDVLAVWHYSSILRILDRAIQLRDLSIKDSGYYGRRIGRSRVYHPWIATETRKLLLPSVTKLLISLDAQSLYAYPSFELPSLTELTFDNFPIELEDLLILMKGMPRVTVLNFNNESQVICERMPVDATEVFSGLESLAVRDRFADYHFLPHFSERCPNLRDVTLHYKYCGNLPTSEMGSLTEATLILEHENDENMGLFSVTQAQGAILFCPNVRKLTLAWQPDYIVTAISFDPFIEALTVQEPGHGVLLQLEHVVLRNAVLSVSTLLEMLQTRSSSRGIFQTIRTDGPFYLTLDGCFSLPNIERGSLNEVRQLFADPPEFNMAFGSSNSPYAPNVVPRATQVS